MTKNQIKKNQTMALETLERSVINAPKILGEEQSYAQAYGYLLESVRTAIKELKEKEVIS